MNIIPAIDLIDGQCVRLSQGAYEQKAVYELTPLEMAKRCESYGIQSLHLVDLDGARLGETKNLSVLEKICDETKLRVDFSGGIRTEVQVRAAFDAGASFVTVGSAAVKEPELVKNWVTSYGSERFIIGADVKAGQIAISGWQEASDWNVEDFLSEWIQIGIKTFLCTSIEKDGMLQGPDFSLYESLREKFPSVSVIVSGGVSSSSDLEQLEKTGATDVIIGKALYEGQISFEDLKRFQC